MAADEISKKPNNCTPNAYTDPPKIAPGCQHMLGCKCDTPFWLRPYTQAELEFESRKIPTVNNEK